MGNKPISYKTEDGMFVSAADIWTPEKLEDLFNRLNPNRTTHVTPKVDKDAIEDTP